MRKWDLFLAVVALFFGLAGLAFIEIIQEEICLKLRKWLKKHGIWKDN